VAKKNGSALDLKAAHQSNDVAKKEDEWKPAAVAKKIDDTTLKMKDPRTKRVDEEDQTDDRKPAAKENVQDKKKRRNAKLPLHSNYAPLLPKSIGKSPNMDLDLDLEETVSESNNEILEDKLKPWKLITALKEREICNLKQAAKDRKKEGSRVRSIPDKADLDLLRASKKPKTEMRKLEIIQDCQEKAYNAELTRLKLATARKSMPAHQRYIKRCINILRQMWKRGAWPNVLNTLHNEMGPAGAFASPYVRGIRVCGISAFLYLSLLLYAFFVTHPRVRHLRFLFSLESFFSPNDLFSVRFHFSLYTHVVLIIYSDCNTYALLFQIFIP
jgi:hypothetical protein